MYYMMAAASVGAHATFNLTIPASFVRESHDSSRLWVSVACAAAASKFLFLTASVSKSVQLVLGVRPARQIVTSTLFCFFLVVCTCE